MDPEAKKRALRMITYGLYVLTAADGDEVAAGTVNWLSQASFEPPLVMVGIKVGSHLHALIERTGAFAVNVLAADQKAIAQDFFRTTKVEDGSSRATPLSGDLRRARPCWWNSRPGGKPGSSIRSPGATTRCTWPKSSRPESAVRTPSPS